MHRASLRLCALTAGLLMASWPAVAATFTWDGGSLVDNNWSTPENWVGNVAPPNDGTADIVMTGTTRPTPNVDTAWSINKLSFTGGTFTLGGSQLTVGAGGLASTGGTGPQTINNAIAVNGNQTWTANSATRALVVNGNLTGTSTILVNTSNIYNALRLGGSNTGFTGTLDLMNSNNQDMLLLKPSAMTGGTVLVGKSGANSNFHLMGAGSPGTYTMGVGSGAGELQFRLAGWGGVAPADGDVDWDPGNGGDYTLASGGFDFGAPVGGSPGINLGNSTSSLVFTGGNKAFWGITNSGVAATMVTVRSALSDDGSPRALTVAGANVALTQPHTGSNGNGNTTIQSYGTLAISNLDQIFGGNLNLSTNGTLMLDGIDWATFTAARSYGTGAGQWQLNGGGFAARSAELLIATNPTGFTWDNRNFTLGTTALLNGVVYGDAGVEIAVPISLGSSATTPRTLLLLGRNIESTTNWTLRGPVHELSGQLSGTVQSLTLQGRGYHLPESLGGTLRISNPANDFVGSVIVQGGGAVGIFTSDGAFGDAANPVKSTDVGGGTAGGMILLEDANSSGPTTFSRALSIEVAHGGGGKSGFGSYAGDTIYTGTVTLTETGVFPGTVPFHVADGTMTLGTAGTPATLANNRTNAAQYNKGGAGELILGDVGYSTGSNPNYTWVLRQGTLTTTQDPATVGTNGGQLASGYLALDSVLYTSGNTWPTWKITTNDQTYSTNNASGHFGFNNLDVEAGRTLTINMGNGILGAGDGTTQWLLHKLGAGTWVYTSTNTGGGFGGPNGFIQVDEGTLDIRGGGSMGGGVSLRLSGGELDVSGAGNRFSASSIFEIDADGGRLGLSPAATADVSRAGVITWTQGLPPVSFAARDNYNLGFTNTDFPDVNAGTTLLIERHGTGTGEVRIYDTAVAVNGTIGGSGRLQMGSAATGTLTVNGFLAPGSSPGTLTLDGNLVMGDGATYLWEIGPGPGGPADHLTDLAVVTGDLTLGGGMTVSIILNGDIDADPAREYDLFRYGGSLTGWNPSAITLDYALAGRLTGATVNLDADGGRIYLTGLVEIPEPATLGMLLAGILVLARRRARRT